MPPCAAVWLGAAVLRSHSKLRRSCCNAETIQKIRDSIHKMVHDPVAAADRKKRTEAYQQGDPQKVKDARRKASESLRARWGLQLHRRYGFKNGKRCQQALGHRTPTSAAAFFHIHRGCSASIMIHHRSWKREVAWHRRPKKKRPSAPRRPRGTKMSEAERQVCLGAASTVYLYIVVCIQEHALYSQDAVALK